MKIKKKGKEKILFIDDEEAIADMTQQMLKRLGYNAIIKTDSVEALEVFKSSPDEFDLVISDMTMPKMTGDILAKELIKIRSDIPIIICTGFNDEKIDEKLSNLGVKGFITKPIFMNDFAKKIRQVLEKSNE